MMSFQAAWLRAAKECFVEENSFATVLKRYMGRKSGTKAIEFPVRAPSKKQLKRRSQLMIRLGEKRDPKQEAIREDKFQRTMSNPKLDDEIRAMFNEMQPEVLALSRPEQQSSLQEKSSPPLPELPTFTIDGVDLLQHFDRFWVSQNKITDTNIDTDKSVNGRAHRQQLSNASKGRITTVNGTSLTTSDLERESNAYVQHKVQVFFRTMNPWFPRKEVPPEYSAVYKIFVNLQKYNLRIDIESYINIIRFQSFYGRYQSADRYFDQALAICPAEDIENTMKLWSAKIENLGRSGQLTEAFATLDRLQKTFQNTTSTTLYNPLLRVLVDGKHVKESDDFWIRMHTDGIDLDVESFNIYLKGLAFRGEVERAFFVFREMVLCTVQPNTESFCMLLHACGRGPWWVKGYEDMVYDALDLIEAAEFKPNRKIYNAIINVFAQSGDAMAAEYYFWEMRRKGLRPDGTTYNVLLEAYARAQSVGLKYGFRGRYAPPPPRALSDDEKAMREVGAKRTGQIMAAGFYAEPVQPGRGTKNEAKKVVLLDLYDDEEARETAMAQIHQEASEVRQLRRAAAAKEFGVKQANSSILNQSEHEHEGNALEKQDGKDEKDDGKVRITWDDPEELEKALSKAGDSLNNIHLQSNDKEEGSSGSDSEVEGGESWDKEFDELDELQRLQERSDSEDGYDELDEILDENLPTTQYRQLQQQHRRVWQRMRDEDFSDPFTKEEGLKGQLWAESRRRRHEHQQHLQKLQRQSEGSKLEATDTDGEHDANSSPANEDTATRNTVNTALLELNQEAELAERVGQRVNILSALDKEDAVKKDLDMMRKEIDREWDHRSFGRAPQQDYAISLITKQNIIKHRAMLAFEDMIEKLIEPNVSHWNRLLAVHSEAIRTDEALTVFNNIKKNKNLIDAKTYEYMIRMYVRAGQVEKAIAMKNESVTQGFIPTEESYGLLIRAFTHRQKIVEALKILEESRSKGVTIRERNIKYLRSRCQALGVKHPDMPPDPNAWVRELREERRNKKLTNQRRVQPFLSKSYR